MALYIIILFVVLCFYLISLSDIETRTIPHTLTLILLSLGCLFCSADGKSDWKFALILFFAFFISQILMYMFLGANNVGGGDVKILTISALFLGNLERLMNYCFFITLFCSAAYIIAKIKKEKHVRFGPYMALTLISTLLCQYCTFIEIIFFDLIFVYLLYLTDVLFFQARRSILNVEKNNIVFER